MSLLLKLNPGDIAYTYFIYNWFYQKDFIYNI
jgi:hypothetical protein